MDLATERVYAMVSALVSAGDGIQNKTLLPQPPMTTLLVASNTSPTWLEMLRRLVTHITSPSAVISHGASAFAVHVVVPSVAPTSGITGMFQGVPFILGAATNLNGNLAGGASTTSNQIRKVLVTVGMSALPVQSGLASAGGTVQFVYGSAFTTSASVVNSGGHSYFDKVPLPLASAGEVPFGWLNVPNNFPISSTVSATMLWSDLRAVQGINLSAMMPNVTQP